MLSMMSQKMVAWVSYKSVVPLRSTSHFSGRLNRHALCRTALASSFLYYNTKPTFLQVGEKAFFREPFWTIPQKTGCRSIFSATAGFRAILHKERLATLCGIALNKKILAVSRSEILQGFFVVLILREQCCPPCVSG